MAVTQAVLPQFRQRKAGVIVNVTSSVTLRPLPLLSVYTASKAAVNAFTESLALELQQFNVRVSLVVPGRSSGDPLSVKTHRPRMQGGIPEAYADFAQSIFTRMGQPSLITRASMWPKRYGMQRTTHRARLVFLPELTLCVGRVLSPALRQREPITFSHTTR